MSLQTTEATDERKEELKAVSRVASPTHNPSPAYNCVISMMATRGTMPAVYLLITAVLNLLITLCCSFKKKKKKRITHLLVFVETEEEEAQSPPTLARSVWLLQSF